MITLKLHKSQNETAKIREGTTRVYLEIHTIQFRKNIFKSYTVFS